MELADLSCRSGFGSKAERGPGCWWKAVPKCTWVRVNECERGRRGGVTNRCLCRRRWWACDRSVDQPRRNGYRHFECGHIGLLRSQQFLEGLGRSAYPCSSASWTADLAIWTAACLSSVVLNNRIRLPSALAKSGRVADLGVESARLLVKRERTVEIAECPENHRLLEQRSREQIVVPELAVDSLPSPSRGGSAPFGNLRVPRKWRRDCRAPKSAPPYSRRCGKPALVPRRGATASSRSPAPGRSRVSFNLGLSNDRSASRTCRRECSLCR